MQVGEFWPPDALINGLRKHRVTLDYDPLDPADFGKNCRYPVWEPTLNHVNAELTVLGDHAYILAQYWPAFEGDRIYDKTVQISLSRRQIAANLNYAIIHRWEVSSRDDPVGWGPHHQREVDRIMAEAKARLEAYAVEADL